MAKPHIACVEERPLDGLFDTNFTLSALEDVSQHLSKRIAPRFLPVSLACNTSRWQLHHASQYRQRQRALPRRYQQAKHSEENKQAWQKVDEQQKIFQAGGQNGSPADASAASNTLEQRHAIEDSAHTLLPVHRDEYTASTIASTTDHVIEYICPPQGSKRCSSVPAAWQGITKEDKDRSKVWGELRHRFFMYRSESNERHFPGETGTSSNAERRSTAEDQQSTDPSVATGSTHNAETAKLDHHPPICSVATQSVYREQEAQTMPYSAAVVIPASQHPEELTISHFCWQNGLPATQFEVAIIQKMRQKRKIESLLPPATDEYSFQLRVALMEEQEFREWADRERQLKELQFQADLSCILNVLKLLLLRESIPILYVSENSGCVVLKERRLELIRQALQARATSARRKQTAVLSRAEDRLKEGRFLFALKKEKQRIKFIRGLWREKLLLEEYLNPTKWKAIANSCSRSSPLYAPKSMNGYIADDPYSSLNLDNLALKDYAQLVELENSIVPPQLPNSFFRKKTNHQKKSEARLKQALERMALHLRQEAVREQASKEGATTNSLDTPAILIGTAAASPQHARDSQISVTKKVYMKNIAERPETPRVEEILPEDEELQVAVILLQRVLRGQACQQRMYEGKEKRLDLINFLRASEQLDDIPVEEQEALAIRETKEELATVLTASFQGFAVAQTLDELSKELRKVQEERRIDAMVALAERDRRLREAQESGTRQAEELLRMREDEAFKRIMAVHQQTVDSYVESILTSTVDHVAQQQAFKEAREKADCLSRVAAAVEEKYKDPLQVSRELMMCFLLPHVKKQQLQRQLRREEEKFALAARHGVQESFRSLCSEHGSLF